MYSRLLLANLLLSFFFSAKGTYPAAYCNAPASSSVSGGTSIHSVAWHCWISTLSKILRFSYTCWINIAIKEINRFSQLCMYSHPLGLARLRINHLYRCCQPPLSSGTPPT